VGDIDPPEETARYRLGKGRDIVLAVENARQNYFISCVYNNCVLVVQRGPLVKIPFE